MNTVFQTSTELAKIGFSVLALCAPELKLLSSTGSLIANAFQFVLKLIDQQKNHEDELNEEYKRAVESAFQSAHTRCMTYHSNRKLFDFLKPRAEQVQRITSDDDWSKFILDLRMAVEKESGLDVTMRDWECCSDILIEEINKEIVKRPLIVPHYVKREMQLLKGELRDHGHRLEHLEKIVSAPPVPFFLEEANERSYTFWLDKCINAQFTLYARTDRVHADLIREVRHQMQESWKSNILRSFADASRDLDSDTQALIQAGLKEIRVPLSFDMQRNRAQNVFDQYLANEPRALGVKSQIMDSCNKVFLIAGEQGAGKSQFMLEFAKSRNSKEFIFPLSCRDILDEKLYTAAQVKKHIFDTVSNAFNEPLFSQSHMLDMQDHSFVCMIDDIQKLYIYNHKCFHAVLRAIRDLTCIDSLSWIITVSEYDLYIMNENHLLEDYCYTGFSVKLFDCAFNLSSWNNSQNTGRNILSKKGIHVEPGGDLFGFERKPINVPLYAHILARFYSDTWLSDSLATHYLFMMELMRLIGENVKSARNDLLPFFNESSQALSLRALEQKNPPFYHGELYSVFRAYTTHSEDLLRVFRDDKLIAWSGVETNLTSPYAQEDIYVLSTKVYWVARIVATTSGASCRENYDRYRQMPDWEHDLIVYYLCYLDAINADGQQDDNIIYLLERLSADHLLHYVLFGAGSASTRLAKQIRVHLNRYTEDCLSPQEAYGLVFFFTAQNLPLPEQCKLTNKFLGSLDKANLSFFLKHSFEKAFRALQNEKKIKQGLVHFIPSRYGEMNFHLGRQFADEYAAAMQDKYPIHLPTLLTETYTLFYQHIDEIHLVREEIDALPTHERYDSFSVCFMRDFFHQLISAYGIKRTYKEAENLLYGEHDNDISLLLRQGFARAAGTRYFLSIPEIDDRYILDFTSVIDRVLANRERWGHRTHLLAFHMISNTIADDRDPDDYVDVSLLPYLETIWNDKSLCYFTHERSGIRDFFIRNGFRPE